MENFLYLLHSNCLVSVKREVVITLTDDIPVILSCNFIDPLASNTKQRCIKGKAIKAHFMAYVIKLHPFNKGFDS